MPIELRSPKFKRQRLDAQTSSHTSPRVFPSLLSDPFRCNDTLAILIPPTTAFPMKREDSSLPVTPKRVKNQAKYLRRRLLKITEVNQEKCTDLTGLVNHNSSTLKSVRNEIKKKKYGIP